jgi:hypothetical protein
MKELGPTPVPLIVPGEAVTEEDVSLWLRLMQLCYDMLQFRHCPTLSEAPICAACLS